MTSKSLIAIRELNAEGRNDREISRRLGIPESTVRVYRKRLGLPTHRGWGEDKMPKYLVYLRETEEFLAIGTKKECSAVMGINPRSFLPTLYKTKKGISKKYIIEHLEED